MKNKQLLLGPLCALAALAGCVSAVDRTPGLGETVAPAPSAPDEQTLCEIVFGVSTRADVEDVLGPTDARETSLSTSLLYQYGSGLTLSLIFRSDVLVEVTVYNGNYPECWAEEERQWAAEAVERAREQQSQDAGT